MVVKPILVSKFFRGRQKTNRELPSDQRNAIINNIDDMAGMNLWELAQISMEPNTPWAKVYKKGSRVTVNWRRDGVDEMYQTIDKSLIKAYSDGSGLYVPNWTINR